MLRGYQAFAAHRVGDDAWLVLDSHVRSVGVMACKSLVDYVKFYHGFPAYSFILLGVVQHTGSTDATAVVDA